jgi:tetratricopeptide (TPR) repeat protein
MATTPPQILSISEIEAVQGPDTLTWHPVRRTLDVRAFGCNAYTAAQAGADVVEPHTEKASGHDELYFVHSGRARFTIDGAVHEAAAGTYVHIPDPQSHRHATALEAGTTVLSFGGPPVFEPSAWEWSFASTPLLRSDPAAARRLLAEGLERHPDAAALRYNLACLEALQGNREEALATLREAISAAPKVAEWARDDADFESLRDDPEFIELVSGA